MLTAVQHPDSALNFWVPIMKNKIIPRNERNEK
jgi:hypothetical protein